MLDTGRKLIVPKEGPIYWLYPDGSHRCLTAEDGGAINALMQHMNVALDALTRIADLQLDDENETLQGIAIIALSKIEGGEA